MRRKRDLTHESEKNTVGRQVREQEVEWEEESNNALSNQSAREQCWGRRSKTGGCPTGMRECLFGHLMKSKSTFKEQKLVATYRTQQLIKQHTADNKFFSLNLLSSSGNAFRCIQIIQAFKIQFGWYLNTLHSLSFKLCADTVKNAKLFVQIQWTTLTNSTDTGSYTAYIKLILIYIWYFIFQLTVSSLFSYNRVTKSQVIPEDCTTGLVSDHLEWDFDYTRIACLCLVMGDEALQNKGRL